MSASHDWLALSLNGRAIASGASVSVQNKKSRNAKPKQITFDTQVKTTLASSFSTEQN